MMCGMKNNVLRPMVIGNGENANGNDAFSRFKKYLAFQCNRTGFQHNDLVDLGNGAFFANV